MATSVSHHQFSTQCLVLGSMLRKLSWFKKGRGQYIENWGLTPNLEVFYLMSSKKMAKGAPYQ